MYPAIPKQTSSRSTAQNEVMHRIAGQTSFRHRIPTRPLIKHVSISVEASQHPAKSTQNWGINLAARASWQRAVLVQSWNESLEEELAILREVAAMEKTMRIQVGADFTEKQIGDLLAWVGPRKGGKLGKGIV
eukprot:1160629-Pelagomonas_calceolata.AAC.12